MRDFVTNQTNEVTADDSPIFFANRLINIYRQLHTLPAEMVTKFARELLTTPDNIRVILPTLPGGEEVVDFINYLTPKSSGVASAPNQPAAPAPEKAEAIIDMSMFTDAKPLDTPPVSPNSPGQAWQVPESQVTNVEKTQMSPPGNA